MRDKKSHYLKFIPYTWRLLEKNEVHPYFLELKRLLIKYTKRTEKKFF